MGVVALPTIVNQVGSAIEKISKARKAIIAPDVEQNARLDKFEERIKDIYKKLENDKKKLEDIHESNRITALALIAILDHNLDGNNIEQMRSAKTELANYLTKK